MTSSPSSADRAHPLDQLARLYALVDQVQRARRVEHVCDEAVEGVRTALPVDWTAIFVRDGGEVTSRTSGGVSNRAGLALTRNPPWRPNDRTARPVVEADIAKGGASPVTRALSRDGIRHAAWIPLLHRGRLIGELVLCRRDPKPFEPAELRLAEAITGHVAFAIWRVRTDEDQAELLRRFEAERSVLDSVIKQMPAGVLLADAPSGRVITSNPQIRAIWRKTLRHASRVTDYAMWGGLDADGAPLDPRAWPLARSVLYGESVRGEEIEIERGDGTRGIVRMSSTPVLDSHGRQLAAVATVYDVTEEREEEARQAFLEEVTGILNASIELSATLDALSQAVVRSFADWCVVYRVRRGRRIDRSAAAHRDPARSELMDVFRRGSIPPDSDHLVARVIRNDEPLLLPDVAPDDLARLSTTDPAVGEATAELAVRSSIILPLAARGEPVGALLLVRSSERYGQGDLALAIELARRASLAVDNALLYEQARSADRAKSRFLAVMSHEFRTPLSAILGYTDILTARVHGELSEKQTEHLDRIKASVRHLSHLVDEILSFASMEAGKERVVRSRVELIALTGDVVGIMEPIAAASGLTLGVSLPGGPLMAVTDPSKLRQIIINLLSNALKYTLEGEVSLELRLEGETAVWVVSDTGPGIAPENLERVFEPFWQVDRPQGARVTGTGLGLAVARRLTRLMGGDLTLESEVGVGSRFTVVLPLQPGTPGAPEVAADPTA
jgi:signal transduction histidine kinase/PAS domain-containing protein